MILYDTMELIKYNIIIHPFTITTFTLFLGVWIGMFVESRIKFWEWGNKCKTRKDMIPWNYTTIHCKDCYNDNCNNEWQAGYDQAKRG